MSEEVLQAEQERIETERTKAQKCADAAEREVEDVMAALNDALAILDEQVVYETLPESTRRLVNQAVFLAIIVSDPDNVQAQRTRRYTRRSRSSSKNCVTPRNAPKPASSPPHQRVRPDAPKTTATPIFGA